MIQSVVYIPTSIDRSVDFYTLYAKKTSTSSSYVVAAKSADAKELQFRISPASAAMTLEDFKRKEPCDIFEYCKYKRCGR